MVAPRSLYVKREKSKSGIAATKIDATTEALRHGGAFEFFGILSNQNFKALEEIEWVIFVSFISV